MVDQISNQDNGVKGTLSNRGCSSPGTLFLTQYGIPSSSFIISIFIDGGPFSYAGLQGAVYLQNKSYNLTKQKRKEKSTYFKVYNKSVKN